MSAEGFTARPGESLARHEKGNDCLDMPSKRDLNRWFASDRRQRPAYIRVMRRSWPLLIVVGLSFAGAGAAYTAVSPMQTPDRKFAKPASLVTAAEPPPAPIIPGAVRLPSDPLAGGGPLEAEAQIVSGDTLSAVLQRSGVGGDEAARAIQSLRKVYDPRTLRDGQAVSIRLASEVSEGAPGRLLGMQLVKSYDRIAGVGRTLDGGFASYEILKPLTQQRARGAGKITSSLFVDGVAADVPVKAMASFIRLFSFDVDFQRDIKPGDRFDIMYDRFVDRDGSVVHSGDILYAALTISGKTMKLFRHEFANGRVKYFNEQGRGNKKALLRTPIDGARISSGFGRRRHPILKYSKMHKGVDFAAPSGTPIKAAGDGVVSKAGWNGGYGRYVRIKHDKTYQTAYAHLRRIAKGIKPGKRVKQGQVIGYVGSSGRSTGPHLHYEILKNAKQVNPRRVRFQSAEALGGKEMKRFKRFRDKINRSLKTSGKPDLVAQTQR